MRPNYKPAEAPKKCLDCKKPPMKRATHTGRHPQRCRDCALMHRRAQWLRSTNAYVARGKKAKNKVKSAKSKAAALPPSKTKAPAKRAVAPSKPKKPAPSLLDVLTKKKTPEAA